MGFRTYGTLARIFLFPSGRSSQRFLEDIRSNLDREVEYSAIRLVNKPYNLNLLIRLIAKIERKVMTRLTMINEEYFRMYLDIPVAHTSLEGEWRVKEARQVDLVTYSDPGLERVLLAVSDRKDVYKYLMQALGRFTREKPQRAVLSFRDDNLIDKLSGRVGEIKWVFVRDIKDPRVSHAMFIGRSLEESELVRHFSSLGQVSGLIIYDKTRKIRITLGRSGTLFTPRPISTPDLASIVKDTLKLLMEMGVLETA